MDYLGEIEADFLAIFQIFEFRDDERLTGPKFIRLATQLPRYDGAVRRRMEFEHMSEGSGDSHAGTQYVTTEDPTQPAPGQTMSMKEAVARGKGDTDGALHAMNQEHSRSQFGALFEYEVG